MVARESLDPGIAGKTHTTMRITVATVASLLLVVSLILSFGFGYSPDSAADQIWHYRNLGKAFYENPTTQIQAVDEFKKALDLAPESARERVNYGLALIRAAKTAEGIEELKKAQKQDPTIPHTWFNLGIAYKRDSDYEKAIVQFEQMVKLVPDDAVSQYNLGVLYKLTGKADLALQHFEISARLDPNLAGPHFQLYNMYKSGNRADDSNRELAAFQAIKKRQAGAAVPEDLEWSFFAEIYDTTEPRADENPPAQVRFKDQSLAGKFEAKNAGLIALDADGDGKPDLLVWSAGAAQVFRTGTTPIEASGLSGLNGFVAISAGDYNNDGLPDLCIISDAGPALFENRKDSFQKAAVNLPAARYSKAVWIDYDHDGDEDLILLGEKCSLFRNNGSAGFSDQTSEFPFVPGQATDGAVVNLIADTPGKDLVIIYKDRPAVLYRDKLAGKFEGAPIEGLPGGAQAVTSYDFNNDGWLDIAVSYSGKILLARNDNGKLKVESGPPSTGSPIVFADLENRAVPDIIAGGGVYRNSGKGSFAPTSRLGAGAIALVSADFNQDGRADIARMDPDGSLHLSLNETESKNHWLRISLLGVKNARLSPGAQVEVKAGPWYQKQVYSGIPLHFGVNTLAEVDTVRITWPNGLIQNQPKQAADKAELYKEAQRLSGSCPMIFTWNGKEFEFITDVLGVAPLGASSGDGQHFPLDHDEYVQIPARAITPADGKYEIRITEELREVSYLDQIHLMAVDHPSEIEIFSNDKFKSPPFPEFRLFGVHARKYPILAKDGTGRDVLEGILARDRKYADGFKRTLSGTAEMHSLELDFGKAAPDNRAVLILNGWVDWADGSTFLSAAQEKSGGLVLPYLQVKDTAGQWKTVIEDMGIPAGKPKTIAVDLTNKFLSSSREVRIVTNLCLYWDDIFISEDPAPPRVKITPMAPDYADLHFRGFSLPTIHPERTQPESFNYSQKMPLSMWNPTQGLYTHYGNVQPLLESADDRMVIMGSGDELTLHFSSSRFPELPKGWSRDYLLLVDGWAKDADPNTAFSQTVEPLPFHAMSGYPYSATESYPEDEFHRMYRAHYNTRPALKLIRPLAQK